MLGAQDIVSILSEDSVRLKIMLTNDISITKGVSILSEDSVRLK